MTQMLPGFSPLPNQTGFQVISGAAQVAARLLELHPSLDEALLRDACEHGYRERLEATELHPPTAAGTYQWHGCVYAIRALLSERGWAQENLRSCPFIVSPDKAVAIAVMTGDLDTGLVAGKPTNQADKGAVLKQAIANNQQLQLFDAQSLAEFAPSEGGTQLWVLLYHVAIGADGKNEVRIELSLPSQFERNRIIGWKERIILSSILPDGELGVQSDAPTGPIDVPVERRTGT